MEAYAKVDPSCLRASPAALWWYSHRPAPNDLDIHLERRADYDGLAVRWGIGHTLGSVEACGEACRQHVPTPGDPHYGALPCNAFTFCDADACFEPDAHAHSRGDCWLKFTEGPAAPEVNMRGRVSAAARARHPAAPELVQWHSGVLLPHGVDLTNGTWGPRYNW